MPIKRGVKGSGPAMGIIGAVEAPAVVVKVVVEGRGEVGLNMS